jgi:dissimilatory sulfite reductase (desulfoviridin) alpha/beta subunit
MKWTGEAEQAVSRVPFFVRKRVKKRVEEEAGRLGSREVTIDHVHTCQKKYLSNMEEEVKGFQVETCFGPSGCPNRAITDNGMAGRIERLLAGKNLKSFLKEKVKGPLKIHHEFRISISDCPNACSRPQIADIGLIGANRPEVSDSPCTGCGACVESCRENAIIFKDAESGPHIDYTKCLSCGKCISACPSGTLRSVQTGWRILIGGKLGRHPQLGTELKGIYSCEQAVLMIERCLDFYMAHNLDGERFGEVINRTGVEVIEDFLKIGSS